MIKRRFRRLKEFLKHKPFQKYWYRIEKFQSGYLTFEKYKTQSNIDFIMKKLWCYQIGKPIFLINIVDFQPTLSWLKFLKEHKEEWWMMRRWDKKINKIKQEKERERRGRKRQIQEKINYIHIIFYDKW